MIRWAATQFRANWRRSHRGITAENLAAVHGTNHSPVGSLSGIEGSRMAEMKFQVCWNRPGANWVVRLGGDHYGAYLTKEHAILDAIDAATDAKADGHDAHV